MPEGGDVFDTKTHALEDGRYHFLISGPGRNVE